MTDEFTGKEQALGTAILDVLDSHWSVKMAHERLKLHEECLEHLWGAYDEEQRRRVLDHLGLKGAALEWPKVLKDLAKQGTKP